MKKLTLSLLFFTAIITIAGAQVSVAPELGLNMANMILKQQLPNNPPNTLSSSMKAGVAIGAIADLTLKSKVFFQPGLFYLMNGCNINGGSSISVNSFQIPLNFVYKAGVNGGNRFFIGVGPYLAYNISGKIKVGSTTQTLVFGSDSTKDLKSIDAGIGINTGVQLSNNFYFRLHFQQGLTNLKPEGDAYNSTKTSAIGVTIGYYFSNKPTKKNNTKKKK